MRLSIIIPAYNEEKRIVKTLEDYGSFFTQVYSEDFEIIVVLNACWDNTLGVVKNFERKYPQIRHLNFKKGGKGFAIIEGFKVAKGELVGFTDADDSTDAEQFHKLVNFLKNNDYSGVIGSRWMKDSIVSPKQSFNRRIASRVFNLLVRLFFGIKYYDTQCGAKVFKINVIKDILPKLGITEWAFDIDLLYHMKKKEYLVKEVPIIWGDIGGSKLNISKTTIKMSLALFRLRMINSPFSFIIKIYDGMPEWIKLNHRI